MQRQTRNSNSKSRLDTPEEWKGIGLPSGQGFSGDEPALDAALIRKVFDLELHEENLIGDFNEKDLDDPLPHHPMKSIFGFDLAPSLDTVFLSCPTVFSSETERVPFCVCSKDPDTHPHDFKCQKCGTCYHADCLGYNEKHDHSQETDLEGWICPFCAPKLDYPLTRRIAPIGSTLHGALLAVLDFMSTGSAATPRTLPEQFRCFK